MRYGQRGFAAVLCLSVIAPIAGAQNPTTDAMRAVFPTHQRDIVAAFDLPPTARPGKN
jgi:hypothetical protein